MWGISNYLNPMMGPPSARNFSTHNPTHPINQPAEKPKPSVLPYIQNIMEEIATNKKFINPNVNISISTPSEVGVLYEKCSKFVNITNGYPNNIRKDCTENLYEEAASGSNKGVPATKSSPVDIMNASEVYLGKSPRKGKKEKMAGNSRSRKKDHRNHNKHNLNTAEMEYLEVDEIGLDACSFISSPAESPCILESFNFPSEYIVHHSDWKPTLDEFITQARSSPIKSVTNIMKFASSPLLVEIKTMAPVCFSISPPGIPGRSCRIERQPSLCASEDSFIQFGNSSCSSEEEYESDDDIEFESDSDDDLNDPQNASNVDEVDSCSCPNQKKVRFAKGKDLEVIHPMHAWSFAYRASRKGHWEEYARDRERFKRRIECFTSDIEKVLDQNHRLNIFNKRFNTDEEIEMET